MYSMKDAVMDHALKRSLSSTSDGIRILDLEEKPKNYAAGNLYIVALEIIREQQNKIKELENKK